MAADLELDLLGLAVALDPGGCKLKWLVFKLRFRNSRKINGETYRKRPSGGRSQ